MRQDAKANTVKLLMCTACGSKELIEQGGVVTCVYCRINYLPEFDDAPVAVSVIGVGSDVQALLAKCRTDPINRMRYAGLVLDLDPTNQEAKGYLEAKGKRKKKR